MGVGSKSLKSLIIILVCVFMSNFALADSDLPMMTGQAYENLIKSFVLRAKNNNYFIENSTANFRNSMIDILTLIYAYSELKSGKGLSNTTKIRLEVQSQQDILNKLEKIMNSLKYRSSDMVYSYSDINSNLLKTVFVATQTISEFAPYLDIKDKALRDTLTLGFKGITAALGGFRFEITRESDASRPYLKPAFLGIKQMNNSLTPPNIFSKIITKFKSTSVPPITQNETGTTCHGFFQ